MDVTSAISLASNVISITFSFLALCGSIYSITRVMAWENTKTEIYPVNPVTGLPLSQGLTGERKTSGLEKLEEALAGIPSQDDYEADFNNVGVEMNPRVERTKEEDLV